MKKNQREKQEQICDHGQEHFSKLRSAHYLKAFYRCMVVRIGQYLVEIKPFKSLEPESVKKFKAFKVLRL